ncbi:MAG: hypothetical protein JW882_10280 [Deltaproteobacteria bacterium]|nr:hypothetical protein [Deltaproteobacteria bacterium]
MNKNKMETFCLRDPGLELPMKVLSIIPAEDGEIILNAMRLANIGVKKGDDVNVFMFGKSALFEQKGKEDFDINKL